MSSRVLVQGVGPVPSQVSDMGLTLLPDRPTLVTWSQALTLTDRRLARVVTSEVDNVDSHSLYWLSPFSQGDGYATAAESMTYWLLQHGIKLSVHHSWFLVKEGLRPETLKVLEDPLRDPMFYGVCMATPGEFAKLPTPYKIGFTMYESTDPLKVYPEWAHQCNDVNRLFVPSLYCKDVFSQFASVPIDVVPLAIHEDYCKPVLRKVREDKPFTVVTFATMTGRKSPLEMVDVFQRAFPTERDVRFVLKTRLKLLGSKHAGLPEFDDPRIVVYSDTWPLSKILRMLYSADCMMFLSKGEGFGMTPREAMATGLPTILADNTGMSGVCNASYNWPVPTRHMESSPLGGEWDVPDWDYAVEVLRDIYERRDQAYAKAFKGANWFIDNHGPSAAAQHFIKVMDRIKRPQRELKKRADMLAKREQYPAVPSRVRQWIQSIVGTRTVLMKTYASMHAIPLNSTVVELGQHVMSLTNEQLRYVVGFAINQGAKAVVLAAPAVFQEPYTWPAARKWRLEELQHVLKGMAVPHLRYIHDHTWVGAVIVQPNGSRLQGFGTVIDRRWKPT